MVAEASQRSQFIHDVRLQPNPPSSATKKRYTPHRKKFISALLMEDEKAMVEIRLQDNIPPKWSDTLTGRPNIMQSIHW